MTKQYWSSVPNGGRSGPLCARPILNTQALAQLRHEWLMSIPLAMLLLRVSFA